VSRNSTTQRDVTRRADYGLDRIFELPPENPRLEVQPLGFETEQFLGHLAAVHDTDQPDVAFDADAARTHLREIQNLLLPVGPYIGDLAGKQMTANATSNLITFFLSEARLEPVGASGALTRYGAELVIPQEQRDKVEILNQLIRCYVIDRPGLAGQQQGQRRIVSNLTGWIAAEPLRLLPPDRREEFQEFGDEIRSAADYVSSMTEAQAVAMHRRMSGVDYGQITDLL
jgi:dGTPase